MKLYATLFILCLNALSCQNETKVDTAVTMNQPKREMYLIYKDIFKGDTVAYDELKTVYLDSPSRDFLYWAVFMANKHNYAPANVDVFYCLLDGYDIGLFKRLDSKTKKMALGFLKEGAKQGDPEAKRILRDLTEKK